jgi:hypothetical protein
VDPFAVVLVVGFVVFAVVIVLLGVYYPGSGLEQLGLRSARQITETREELDALDLDQMLVARNARRAARGEAEVSSEEYERQVFQEEAAARRRHQERLQADEELDQLLALTNARRRARGLPERTRAQAEEELGQRASRQEPRSESQPPPEAPPG